MGTTGRGRSRKARVETTPFESPSQLVVIASADAGLTAEPGSVAAASVDAAPIGKALTAAKAQMRPLFGASEERLRYQASQAASLTGISQPDLSVYYTVEADDSRLEGLAQDMLAKEGIIGAYVAPGAEPAVDLTALNEMTPSPDPAPPVTPDFTARQIYLDAAPAGIDARYAWTLPGGQGAGVRIIDIEGAWRFDHEDLVVNQGGVVGTASTDLGWRNHGTAVVSEFGGDVSAFGVTGICPDANTRGFSIFGPGGSPANAIRTAADALSAGDIILIELHRPGPGASGSGQDGFIAMEWWPAEWDAIRYATNKGVIVVEAAGNGSRNLDDPIYNTPQAGFPAGWTNPFNRANRDSGAIVVGAGAPPPNTHGRDHGPDRSRLGFSNWGALVDAQGWGREVTAAGYGDLQGGSVETLWYTDTFSGTSSASPIVVGACGCVQGVRRAQGLAVLTSTQMRARLRASGSPQQDAPGRPATQRIGNRPNLRQLVARKTRFKELIKDKEKREVKELKEFKEKPEKVEIKEKREKLEKNEKVELKDKNEKIERKEIKDVALEKIQVQEIEKIQVREFEEKRIDEQIKFRDVDDRFRQQFERGGLEERIGQLEETLGQLSHFITGELRPDLSTGALSGEVDWGADDPDAKYQVEKLSEG